MQQPCLLKTVFVQLTCNHKYIYVGNVIALPFGYVYSELKVT